MYLFALIYDEAYSHMLSFYNRFCICFSSQGGYFPHLQPAHTPPLPPGSFKSFRR